MTTSRPRSTFIAAASTCRLVPPKSQKSPECNGRRHPEWNRHAASISEAYCLAISRDELTIPESEYSFVYRHSLAVEGLVSLGVARSLRFIRWGRLHRHYTAPMMCIVRTRRAKTVDRFLADPYSRSYPGHPDRPMSMRTPTGEGMLIPGIVIRPRRSALTKIGLALPIRMLRGSPRLVLNCCTAAQRHVGPHGILDARIVGQHGDRVLLAGPSTSFQSMPRFIQPTTSPSSGRPSPGLRLLEVLENAGKL